MWTSCVQILSLTIAVYVTKEVIYSLLLLLHYLYTIMVSKVLPEWSTNMF